MTKGYVVRYTNERGTFYVAAPKWLDDYTIGTARTDEGVLFDALPAAVAASRHPRKVTTVTILAVAEDGAETEVPTHEEALALLTEVAPFRDLLAQIVAAWRADEIGQIDGSLIEEAEALLGIDADADPLAVESEEPGR